jgi:hypothetical protein
VSYCLNKEFCRKEQEKCLTLNEYNDAAAADDDNYYYDDDDDDEFCRKIGRQIQNT